MALTNFILTVAGVGAVVLLFRTDVKHSAAIFRRNVRQIRQWLEEESASTSKYAEFIHSSPRWRFGFLRLIYMVSTVISLNSIHVYIWFRAADKVKHKKLESQVPQKDVNKEGKQ